MIRPKVISPQMPSVSEQLQKYRTLYTQDNLRATTRPCDVTWKHPKTSEYFNKLMERWRAQYVREAVPADQN